MDYSPEEYIMDNLKSVEQTEKKKIALSGIQPSGIFTLGNYIGAVRNWNDLQDSYNCLFMVANMHTT